MRALRIHEAATDEAADRRTGLRENEHDTDRRAEAETECARNEVMVPVLHLEIRRDRRELFCAHSTDRLRPEADLGASAHPN